MNSRKSADKSLWIGITDCHKLCKINVDPDLATQRQQNQSNLLKSSTDIQLTLFFL